MAENTGGDSVLDHLSLYPDIDSDWESLLYYCRHRNRPSGCAANLRNRDGPDSLGDFSDAAAKMVPGGDASGPLSGLLFYERICRSKADGEKNGADTSGNIDVHVRGPSVIRISGIYSRSGGAYADRRFGGRVLEKWK